jgi:transcriptional/translational regulatory protein YebC/TACO1
MFSRHGLIIIEKTRDTDEDMIMETALEAGMEDMKTHEDSFEIITDPDDFPKVKQALQEAGYEFVEADIEYLPSTEATPPEEDLGKLKKMIEVLENNDDVQKVYHNCSIDLEQ